jgi:hypothetical protein
MPAASYHIPFVADYGTAKAVAYEFDTTKCARLLRVFIGDRLWLSKAKQHAK